VDETSFDSIFDFHADLEEIFALHQESLLLLELERARALCGAYRRLLALHMSHEEEQLLPIFARAGHIERWPSVLYTGQHQKMNALLDRIEQRLDAMIADPPLNRRRAVISLLDLETTYKHLGEHHDGAEREGFVPNLDRVSDSAERSSLLDRFRAEWHAALALEKAVIELARRELSLG
jgi:hypothetical protein